VLVTYGWTHLPSGASWRWEGTRGAAGGGGASETVGCGWTGDAETRGGVEVGP
jgi:hypothetical protein